MGLGTDIVYINRFKELQNDTTFMNKVFLTSELAYFESRNNNLATIAGMFALKEAFLKAIKKGINNYQLKDIEICHDNNNAPYITLHNELKNVLNNRSIAVSISHDGDYAIATAIINN